MNDWVELLAFVFVPAAFFIGLQVLLRRVIPPERLAPHHDVAGFLVAIVGVLYAVVLGFVVVTVWAHFDTVQHTADTEASDVADAVVFAGFLAEPTRSRVTRDLANYAIEVHDVEWEMLRHGKPDPKARQYLVDALEAVADAPVKTERLGEALRAEARRSRVVDALVNVANNRRQRLVEASEKVPRALFVALIVGALMVMSFVYLFGVENAVQQYVMTGTVAGCIGLLFGVIVEFSAPYSGALRVDRDAWRLAIYSNRQAARHFKIEGIPQRPAVASPKP